MNALDVRQVIAVLANPRTRELYARVILGEVDRGELERNSRDRRSLAALTSAGLVAIASDDRLTAPIEPLGSLIRSFPASPAREGIHRFVREDRIESYPANPVVRRELLQWLVERVLDEGEVLSEREVTERLDGHGIDGVTLRRYLVDEGLLERTRSGSSYARRRDG